MPTSPPQTVLCRYRYDPLDRSVTWALDRQAHLQRFYCQNRLTTEIQDAETRSIFQHDDQVLAQHNHLDLKVENTLLATDQQRSVLNALNSLLPHNNAYLPYGHRPFEQGLLSLLGFNGEPPDRVTGHYHLGNGYRQYNPVLMRFNGPDKLSPFGKGGVNAYAYCGNDPINWSDPNGRMPQRLPLRKAITALDANKLVDYMTSNRMRPKVKYGEHKAAGHRKRIVDLNDYTDDVQHMISRVFDDKVADAQHIFKAMNKTLTHPASTATTAKFSSRTQKNNLIATTSALRMRAIQLVQMDISKPELAQIKLLKQVQLLREGNALHRDLQRLIPNYDVAHGNMVETMSVRRSQIHRVRFDVPED